MDLRVAIALVPLGFAGCGPKCPPREPSPLTIALERSEPWLPGRYAISVSSYLHGFGGLDALCVVDLPYETGDLVLCTENAELVMGAMQIDAMVAQVGGASSGQLWVLRDDEVLFSDQLGDILRSPEESFEACQAEPIERFTVQL
ncbi:MAG: hypothetical protein R3F61_01510 [Myxococcota bacterium]